LYTGILVNVANFCLNSNMLSYGYNVHSSNIYTIVGVVGAVYAVFDCLRAVAGCVGVGSTGAFVGSAGASDCSPGARISSSSAILISSLTLALLVLLVVAGPVVSSVLAIPVSSLVK